MVSVVAAPGAGRPPQMHAYAADVPPSMTLTPAQQQVVVVAAHGMTVLESARCLGIAYHTVKNHHTAITERLGARNITHAVYIAMKLGLIS